MNAHLTFKEKMDLLTAFVSMEQALKSHFHNWTAAELLAYEKAMAVIGVVGNVNEPVKHPSAN